ADAAAAGQAAGINLRDTIRVEEILLHARRLRLTTTPAARPRALLLSNHKNQYNGETNDQDGRWRQHIAPACDSRRKHRLCARMVRLLPLRHRRRAGVRRVVLPEERSGGRHAAVVPDLRRRLRGATVRRPVVRHPRRPLWPQAGAGRNPADDRHRHHGDRLPADLCADRRLGAD
ncbi:hypothetical protein chiPu_0033556, partial [Chiloscyllium punctatum]|nr:hypothetical protein [Chiloscyllium punctatum]